ncbi:ABC1 family-domain-containing protein [Baffinella frigidus]|nr:ABC1 family-domain-containing protein [Cryptophyta sp. CCMP2293]
MRAWGGGVRVRKKTFPTNLSPETLGRVLQAALTAAGPTGVKIGQALSNRPDLVGQEYMDALGALQDDVGAFSTEEAARIIAANLGADVAEVLERLPVAPVASASLGQVYRARLRGMAPGQEVAVKVQRPGLASLIPLDMYILRGVAGIGKMVLKLRSDLPSILDEFASRLFEEIDYNQEANNAIRFGQLYGDIEGLVVPSIYPDFCSRQVLTMEWIQGTKAPWTEGKGNDAPEGPRGSEVERKAWAELIKVGVQCNLKQLLDDGFFHADPHSGNLLKTENGDLAYLDFGMMSSLSQPRRYELIAAIVHLINRDYKLLARDFQVLEFIPEDFEDLDAMSVALEKAFGDASSGGRLAAVNFAKLADNLAAIAFRFPFRIPAYYSLIIRSLTILEVPPPPLPPPLQYWIPLGGLRGFR